MAIVIRNLEEDEYGHAIQICHSTSNEPPDGSYIPWIMVSSSFLGESEEVNFSLSEALVLEEQLEKFIELHREER